MIVSILVMFSGIAWAQLKLEPASPTWGAEVTITADPSVIPGPEATVFYRSDVVYAVMSTLHQGLWRSNFVRMSWDGAKFVSRMTVPEGCERGGVGLSTNEKYLNIRQIFIPKSKDGAIPPGALLAALDYGGYDRKNWKSDIETEFSKGADLSWAYQCVWGARYIAMRNISAEELLRDVERVEKENKETPALLKSLSYGYFLAGQPKKAFELLERLCSNYPDSPYAVVALNDADYQVFSSHREDLKSEVLRLYAEIANKAPGNPGFRQSANSMSYLCKTSGISIDNIRKLCREWSTAKPGSMRPYLVLSDALTKGGALPEAEELATKAIELSYLPHPADYPVDDLYLGQAYRLRAQIRSQRLDFIDALSDSKMAQALAPQGSTEDLDAEVELWNRLGHPGKAENMALEAYRRGSLSAENFLKTLYTTRVGTEEGFQDYFIAKLTGTKPPEKSSTPAPAFEATTLDGAWVRLEDLRGKVVVLNFWFINCGPCRGEIPELNKIVDEFKDRVRFLAFAVDSASALKDFLKENTFRYEIIPGESVKFAGDYPVEGYPTHFIIDQNGKIAWEARGANPDNIQRLRAMLQRLLSNRDN
jgi:peroxiredoxin/tetratricopeptide (TPR) repeat protein